MTFRSSSSLSLSLIVCALWTVLIQSWSCKWGNRHSGLDWARNNSTHTKLFKSQLFRSTEGIWLAVELKYQQPSPPLGITIFKGKHACLQHTVPWQRQVSSRSRHSFWVWRPKHCGVPAHTIEACVQRLHLYNDLLTQGTVHHSAGVQFFSYQYVCSSLHHQTHDLSAVSTFLSVVSTLICQLSME